MKELASGAIALICLLLPFLTVVHVGHLGSADRSHANRPDPRPISTDPPAQIIEHHEVVLEAGDQAVITDRGQTVTITKLPTESRRAN